VRIGQNKGEEFGVWGMVGQVKDCRLHARRSDCTFLLQLSIRNRLANTTTLRFTQDCIPRLRLSPCPTRRPHLDRKSAVCNCAILESAQRPGLLNQLSVPDSFTAHVLAHRQGHITSRVVPTNATPPPRRGFPSHSSTSSADYRHFGSLGRTFSKPPFFYPPDL